MVERSFVEQDVSFDANGLRLAGTLASGSASPADVTGWTAATRGGQTL